MRESHRSIQPPSRFALVGEARIPFEWLAMRFSLPLLRNTAPGGDGSPVLVAPGFATDDNATKSLRGFLRSIGYTSFGWELGRNHGRVPVLLPKLIQRTADIARETGQAVRLVGWSLGGYLVREVARERPDVVDRVITLGAPVVGGPKYTASAPMYRRKGYDLDSIEDEVCKRDRNPIRVPIDAIYSRSDGIVAWRACIDDVSPQAHHHEVSTSHLGLVASPSVFRIVARLLA